MCKWSPPPPPPPPDFHFVFHLPKKGNEKENKKVSNNMADDTNSATISLHRPLSDLKFNAVEDVSSCAREPPRGSPPGRDDLANVHTVRVLRSVEAQIRLLALPSPRPFCHHTPFATCMVSEGTLALLSACRFLLRGRDLAVARDQIRMSIGCLRALGDVWPRTAKNVQEIQIIARHVLGIDPPPSASASASVSGAGDGAGMGPGSGDYATGSSLQHPGSVPSLTGGEGHPSSGSDTGASSEGQFSLSNIDGLCGWLSPAEMGPELSWWINGT